MTPNATSWLVTPAASSRQLGDEPRSVVRADATAARGGAEVRAATAIRWVDRRGVALVEVVLDGWRFELEVENADRAALRARATRVGDRVAASGPLEVRAMIPGRVAEVRIASGDTVTAGQTLLVVEAMKMQNELQASRAGTILGVAIAAGDTIDLGDLLVTIE